MKQTINLSGTKKGLDQLPLRVQRFRLRMMRYSFSISHVPGKSLAVADTLSRAPTSTLAASDRELQTEAAFYVSRILSCLPAIEKRVAEIKQQQHEDHVCKQLIEFCLIQWPNRKVLSDDLRPYYSVAHEMSVEDGLLLRGNQMVIPSALRDDILGRIRAGHLGIAKCRERARHGVWWPGLSTQLEQQVKNCRECCKTQSQRAEPLLPSPLPELPFQKVGTDLFEWSNKTYLLVDDYFSRFIEIAKLPTMTAAEVINHTKSIFARHGIPEVVISNNGPQYVSAAYAQFAHDYGFSHFTSSPLYPQGNGEAERAVKTIKELLKKGGDPYMALLAHRSTPLQCGYSPSELLMCRKLRTSVPTTRSCLIPVVPDNDKLREKDGRQKRQQQQSFNARHRANPLPHLNPGDRVWISDRESEAEVVKEINPHS